MKKREKNTSPKSDKEKLDTMRKAYKISTWTGLLFAFAAAVLMLVNSIKLGAQSSRISDKMSETAISETGNIKLPEKPEPAGKDESGEDVYDYFEDLLWEAGSSYADALRYYDSMYAVAVELDESGYETSSLFSHTDNESYRRAADEASQDAKSLIPDLKQKDPVPRESVTKFYNCITLIYEATRFTDSMSAAGSTACTDAIGKIRIKSNTYTIAGVLTAVAAMLISITSLLADKTIALTGKRRRRGPVAGQEPVYEVKIR